MIASADKAAGGFLRECQELGDVGLAELDGAAEIVVTEGTTAVAYPRADFIIEKRIIHNKRLD